jgi:HSP20 family molecular chaperone IbpA
MSFLNTLIPNLNGTHAETTPERRPRHLIREDEAGYTLTVYLPGVTKDALEITDENGDLTITGRSTTKLPEGLSVLHRESSDAAFRLVIAHDNTIDAEKIGAELKDGVLQLTLAKAESAKPRKVAVS